MSRTTNSRNNTIIFSWYKTGVYNIVDGIVKVVQPIVFQFIILPVYTLLRSLCVILLFLSRSSLVTHSSHDARALCQVFCAYVKDSARVCTILYYRLQTRQSQYKHKVLEMRIQMLYIVLISRRLDANYICQAPSGRFSYYVTPTLIGTGRVVVQRAEPTACALSAVDHGADESASTRRSENNGAISRTN